MRTREIGKVISVDSFRITIELKEDLKSLYKSGFEDLYEIAKINSYVVLPVGDEKVIAMITKVHIFEENNKSKDTIYLPKSKRHILATMIGTITSSNKYVQGVYNFPILNNPVWYIKKEDLNVIFDYNEKKKIDFKNDYFLPIGKSPIFNDFEVKINPDKFFGKHAAILGNTGAGKSCTVTTILQSIFKEKFNNQYVENGHFIIFDTNGEYKKAFDFENKDINKRVNAFTITKEGLKVPYWFMNYNDFDYLFNPAPQTQAPILQKSLKLAKNKNNKKDIDNKILITKSLLEKLESYIIDTADTKINRFLYHHYDDFKSEFEDDTFFNNDLKNFVDSVKNSNRGDDKYFSDNRLTKDNRTQLLNELQSKIETLYEKNENEKFSNELLDIPVPFDYKLLITEYLEQAINEFEETNFNIRQNISTLRLRLFRFFNDKRYSNIFMFDKNFKDENLLIEFFKYIFGLLDSTNENIFKKYKFDKENDNYNEKNQIIILDMSMLSSEVLENVTGLIGRLILEFLSRVNKVEDLNRNDIPITLILEEAQNYIPKTYYNDGDQKESISKTIFDRIAREGRKYGLSLVLASQRPSELSKTVLSQCNSYIIHRLQNPEDQRYVKQLVSSVNEDILNQLPVLPQKHAIILGDAVRSPVQVEMRNVDPKPDSKDPEFFDKWINGDKLTKENIEKVVNKWIKNNKDQDNVSSSAEEQNDDSEINNSLEENNDTQSENINNGQNDSNSQTNNDDVEEYYEEDDDIPF